MREAYRKEVMLTNTTTTRLLVLLATYNKLLGLYQNLTKVMNATLDLVRAQEAAIVYNSSIVAVSEGVRLMYMASNLTVLANTTSDPQAKQVYAKEAMLAANESAHVLQVLAVAGKVLGLNQTFFSRIEAAQAAAYNVVSLANSVSSSTNPQLGPELVNDVDMYYVNIAGAELQLAESARALLQSQSTS